MKSHGAIWRVVDEGANAGTEDKPIFGDTPTFSQVFKGVSDKIMTKSPLGLIGEYKRVLYTDNTVNLSVGSLVFNGTTYYRIDGNDPINPGGVPIMNVYELVAGP